MWRSRFFSPSKTVLPAGQDKPRGGRGRVAAQGASPCMSTACVHCCEVYVHVCSCATKSRCIRCSLSEIVAFWEGKKKNCSGE